MLFPPLPVFMLSLTNGHTVRAFYCRVCRCGANFRYFVYYWSISSVELQHTVYRVFLCKKNNNNKEL